MKIQKKPWSVLISAAELLVGVAMTAAAFGWFIVPQGFAAGGVTGLAKLLCKLLPLPLSVMVYCINIPLLILGWAVMGRKFLAKTIAVSALFPAMLELFTRWKIAFGEQDTFLTALIAGALLGIGTGLVLRSNASCGGFDIVAMVLNRKLHWPVALVVRVCDCTMLLLQAIGQPLMPTVYGILVILVTTTCINRVVTMGTGETQVLIFSPSYIAIRDVLMQELDVGVTMLHGETGYRKQSTQVVLSVMPYRKVAQMKRLVHEIDPAAFVVVDEIHSVLGKGYTFNRYSSPELSSKGEKL